MEVDAASALGVQAFVASDLIKSFGEGEAKRTAGKGIALSARFG
jgi:hypothetical protein